jgi:hypothetical protein
MAPKKKKAKKTARTAPKKAKNKAPTKAPKKKAAPRKPKPVAKRPPAPKAKKGATRPAAAPPPKNFAQKVRDCDAGTAVWFMVAGGIEHAVIQRRGGDGAVMIRTDAGVPEVVASGNLFETADEARAARFR